MTGKPAGQHALRDQGRYMPDLSDQGLMRHAGPFVGRDGGAALIEADSEAAVRKLLEAVPVVVEAVMVYALRQWSRQDWRSHSDRRKERSQRRQAPQGGAGSRPGTVLPPTTGRTLADTQLTVATTPIDRACRPGWSARGSSGDLARVIRETMWSGSGWRSARRRTTTARRLAGVTGTYLAALRIGE